MQIDAHRVRLRCWRETDRDAFAALHGDPEVMVDAVGLLDRAQSDAKLDRYVAVADALGYGRWCLETRAGDFLGYVGVLTSPPGHPLGPHAEIGWRLARSAWGRGYVTEGARAALDDVFARCGLKEVLAYTAPDNLRSRAVMARLELRRDSSLDFAVPDGPRIWHGRTWVAHAPGTSPLGPRQARSN